MSTMGCENCSNCTPSNCQPGYYGSSCNMMCSANCRIVPCLSCACAVCNETSGHCLNGCTSGWYGELCEEQCSVNCSMAHSLPTKCEQNTGTCLYGCTDGLFGSTCNETCGSNCENALCNQTTGECLSGCIRGFKGYLCQEKNTEDDQVAGAVGGAFVIIIWGFIVIILICVIRRRRQKEYETFARNRSLNSGRGSSRRQLQREASVSSEIPPHLANEVEQYTYEIVIPDFELQKALYDAGRPPFMRSYSDESPMMDLCEHYTTMELRSGFRKKCHSMQNSRDYGNPDDDDQSSDLNKPTSSDEEAEDPNMCAEMWKIRKF